MTANSAQPAHPHAVAFKAAWQEFTQACAGTIAPEATYQAWLAHFMINRVGLLQRRARGGLRCPSSRRKQPPNASGAAT